MIKQGDIVYFLGIGGIGMSALARWCQKQGAIIYGYDLTETVLTDQLQSEGMKLHFNVDISLIPDNISMGIYTPAVPLTNAELIYIKEKKIPLYKRAELIGKITESFKTIAIGGTHGKTSVTALTAHILANAGINITAFVGGICRNYNSNLILSGKTDYILIEADEYDRSFLHLKPEIAVITSTDEDHLDIYADHADIKNAFNDFAANVAVDGSLIYKKGIGPFGHTLCQKSTYSSNSSANVMLAKLKIKNNKYIADITTDEFTLKDIEIQVPGIHNIENTLAAVAIAQCIGLKPEIIKQGIETFKGVERRMDYRINNDDIVYIDDYAHHPEEIRNTINTLKELYPLKKITGIFQPHLYSRTRDFAQEFATQLGQLDEIILLDIYPAREHPIAGITSEIIAEKIAGKKTILLQKDELIEYLRKSKPEVLISMGAGDIGLLVNKIEKALSC